MNERLVPSPQSGPDLTSPASSDESEGECWERTTRDLRQQVTRRVRVQAASEIKTALPDRPVRHCVVIIEETQTESERGDIMALFKWREARTG
jgi:hypothetical protein